MVGERASEGWSDEGKRGEEGELCNLGKEREGEDESSRCLFDSPDCGERAVRTVACLDPA